MSCARALWEERSSIPVPGGHESRPRRAVRLRERTALLLWEEGGEGKWRARWPGQSGLLGFPGLSQRML